MSTWTPELSSRVGSATELGLASRRADGSLSGSTTMWVVEVGGEIYVRSADGPDRPWYRRALANGSGRVRPVGIEVGVSFDTATADAPDAIDAEYHAKYDRYGPGPVGHVTGAASHPVTIRLVPLDPHLSRLRSLVASLSTCSPTSACACGSAAAWAAADPWRPPSRSRSSPWRRTRARS